MWHKFRLQYLPTFTVLNFQEKHLHRTCLTLHAIIRQLLHPQFFAEDKLRK